MRISDWSSDVCSSDLFLVFVSNAVQGDLGRSFVYSTDALGLILSKLPATLELAFLALVIAIFLGVPLGMLAGLKPDSIVGKTIMGGSILGFSLPNFWQGMMLILLFAVIFKVLPSGGRGETVEVLRSEEHTYELQSLMRISYAVF